MKNRPVFIVICSILILLCTIPAAGQPDAARVKEEVNKLARELNLIPKEPPDNPVSLFFDSIFKCIASFISSLIGLGWIVGIPVILLLVFLTGFIGLRIFPYFRKEKDTFAQLHGTDKKTGEKAGNSLYHYLQKAEDLAKKDKYGEALVILHKGSIFFLQWKKILLGTEYHTNNEIRRELRHNKEYYETYYEPFSTLAGIAERKTFGAGTISPDLYKESMEMFKKNFA